MEKDEGRHLPSNQVCSNPLLFSSSFIWKQAVWEFLNDVWQQHCRWGWTTPNGNTFGTSQEQPLTWSESISSTWWSNSGFVSSFNPTCGSVALLLAVAAMFGLRELQAWAASKRSSIPAANDPLAAFLPLRFTVTISGEETLIDWLSVSPAHWSLEEGLRTCVCVG